MIPQSTAGDGSISSSEDLIRARRFMQLQFPLLCCSDALATTLSALYGKLLVVMGIAFPMAEVISTYIPPSFYEAFYLYLYFGSMIFLVYMYAMLCSDSKTKPSESKNASKKFTSVVPSSLSVAINIPDSVGNIDSTFTSVEVDKARRGQTAALAIAALHTDQSTFMRTVTQC